MRELRCVIVASTNGSVFGELLKNEFFKGCIYSVVSDRDCGAIEKAKSNGIKHEIFYEKDKKQFCDKLLEYLKSNNIDYVISFYTKLFVGDILDCYKNRIINLHPALLPSFKGLDGFGDAVSYGVKFVGSTIHFIDDKVDEGTIIMQTVTPVDRNKDIAYTRNIIFQQQCKSLLQIVKWIYDNRIELKDNSVNVKNCSYDSSEFSPSLDFDEAIRLFK